MAVQHDGKSHDIGLGYWVQWEDSRAGVGKTSERKWSLSWVDSVRGRAFLNENKGKMDPGGLEQNFPVQCGLLYPRVT